MKEYKKILLLMLLMILTTGCTMEKNNGLSNEPLSKTEFMMDTIMTIRIYDKKDNKVLEKVFERLEDIENKMSATIDTSEINKVNNNAGIEPVKVSEDTYFVLKEAKYHAKISDGAYEPTIGPLVSLWNIQTEDDLNRDWIPELEDIEKTKELVDYEDLELLDNNEVFLKRKGMRLDLGGIVKGYAADEARKILQENEVNIAIIDLGGNIYAHGIKSDGIPWKIGIQNPIEVTGDYLGVLDVKDKSVVTSGNYERFFRYEGRKYHHIIDRETGYPAENEITGVTIISDRSIDGDALSTALFILGIEKSMEIINSMDGVDAIFITKDKMIYLTKNIKDKFKLEESNSEFVIQEY